MSTEIDNAITEALQELTPDISEKSCPTGQDTYICDLMYHALHCWSCGWTGAIFEVASLDDFARVRAKARRIGLLEQIRIERGQASDMQEVPGGKTGLLVKEYKGQSVFPVYKLDAALLKEMRDLEGEIAIELGQWTEKKELTGAGGEPLLDPLVAALEKAYGNGKGQPIPTY